MEESRITGENRISMEESETAGAIREQLAGIGNQILSAARTELYLGMRFLDVALSSFVYEMDSSVSPFGTDGAVMYYHPRQLGGLYKQNRILVNRGYLHMVYHCIFRHMTKDIPGLCWSDVQRVERTELSETEDPDNSDHSVRKETVILRYWNLSCDIAVERLIDGNFHRSVRSSKSLLRRETYRRLETAAEKKTLNAERIFKILQEWSLPEKELARLEQEFYVDDHCRWENEQSGKKQPDPMLNRKWQDISEQTQTELETFSKEASEQSGDLLGQVKVENRERYDYRAFLRKFSVLREELGVDPDTFDYAFYSYGLSLYGNMPLIEPVETKETMKIQEFAVVIDTSMSCSGTLVKRFLEETYSVLSENESFFRKVNVHIIQCDESVQSDVKITCGQELQSYMDSLELFGEGGTDFRPAFAYVNRLEEQGEFEDLRGLIYFTDGYGIYPAKKPRYQTAFVFFQEDYTDVDVPPWAVKLLLDEDDLRKEERDGY